MKMLLIWLVYSHIITACIYKDIYEKPVSIKTNKIDNKEAIDAQKLKEKIASDNTQIKAKL